MNKMSFLHPREQIVAIMQRIYDGGMTTTSGGNLSILDEDGSMWISPGGIDKGTLRPCDIVHVLADRTVEGIHKPSSEYPFHRAVYKRRPDVKALLHAHPPTLVSFSIAGIVPDVTALATAGAICGKIGFAPYEIPGSEALGKNVADTFVSGNYNAILLENHGACVVGKSLQEAFERFEALDFCARSISSAKRLGGAKPCSAEDLELIAKDNAKIAPTQNEAKYTSEELDLIGTTAALVRRAYKQKLVTAIGGFFALRLGNGRIAVSAPRCDRAQLTTADFEVVKATDISDASPFALKLVKGVFQKQSDLNAIFITTPPSLGGYIVAHTKFDARVIPESYILLRETPMFSLKDAHLTSKVAETLSTRLPVVLVENGGAISAGRTPLEAFDRMEVAEYSAIATLKAMEFGGMKPINDAQVADLVAAFKLIP